MHAKAAVLRATHQPFTIEDIAIAAPRADEILVDVVATGLCHSDIAVAAGALPFPLPGVLGHEGAGVVRQVGKAVRSVAPGDHVILSFDSCGNCHDCHAGTPSYCREFASRNFGGSRPDGSKALSDEQGALSGNFFGQSSFAALALAGERNVVKVDKSLPLHLLGPLGCGIQTGAGAILKSFRCAAGSALLVIGGGAVGLAAVMAGALCGCGPIIVIEPVAARRALAHELGATHSFAPDDATPDALRAIAGDGVDYVLDTSARPGMLDLAVDILKKRGSIGLVGVPATPDVRWSLAFLKIVRLGATIRGIVEGDADPHSFIPELLAHYQAGRFPFDRMITLYPLEQINAAIEEQRQGRAVKIVLQF